MRYVRAQDIFPGEILEIIQQYVDGEYIYIPRKESQKRTWGETTNYRQELCARNAAIYASYLGGADVKELGERFFLSEKSIRRIVLEEKRK